MYVYVAPSFVICLTSTKIFTSKVYDLQKAKGEAEIKLEQDLPLCGDVKIEFYHSSKLSRKVCAYVNRSVFFP